MFQVVFLLLVTAGCISVSVAGTSASNSANSALSHRCPITNTTNMIYSVVEGVGPASQIWVQDLLWWEAYHVVLSC